MSSKKIVVTGLGVISSTGIGKAAFFDSLYSGVSGIKPISLFDTTAFKVKNAGEISNFDPQEFLGPKGLRTLDRSTKLLNSAAKLALDDAGIMIDESNTKDTGFVCGTTLGSLSSISGFDKDALNDGPQYVNPAFFPNTVVNSPSSQVAIRFNIKGFNTTISSGFTAGFDAVKYAVDFLKLGRAKIVLAAAVEELCIQTYLGFLKTGFLAGANGQGLEISCPFDRRRNGFVLGEGTAVIVLEDLESARQRGAKVYGQISGFGAGFNTDNAAISSMASALKNSGVGNSEIDYISSAANSSLEVDAAESSAIEEVFGKSIPVTSVKSMIGECFSASGILQLAASIGSVERQAVFPTINYSEKDPECGLDNIVNKPKDCRVSNVMLNACGNNSRCLSMVFSKIKD